MQEQSGNPALNNKVLKKVLAVESTDNATIPGTISKTLILMILVVLSGSFSWKLVSSGSSMLPLLIFISLISVFVFGLMASFFPKTSPVAAPLYAISEGILLGTISKLENAVYSGIVVQAIALTGVIFFSALFMYSTGLVKVTQKFQSIVFIATGGIFLYYFLSIVLNLFHVQMPLIYDSGPVGIIFSLIVIFIAALNLFLDFNLVETAVKNRAPKIFEWYGAFALIVTIIWLYIEVIRLLSRIRD
jgi:hypothetical protein